MIFLFQNSNIFFIKDKFKIMDKILFFLLFSPLTFSSQQLDLLEILDLTKSKKKFEQKMYSIGNVFTENDFGSPGYSYYGTDKNGEECIVGSSDLTDIPTNDISKRKKFFSIVNSNYLYEDSFNRCGSSSSKRGDTTYIFNRSGNEKEICDVLVCLNCADVKGYSYHNCYTLEVEKSQRSTIEFAHNYNKTRETATTWYEFSQFNYTDLSGNKVRSYNILEVFYADEIHYKKIIAEISKNCEYIETRYYAEFEYKSKYIEEPCKIRCDSKNKTIFLNWSIKI